LLALATVRGAGGYRGTPRAKRCHGSSESIADRTICREGRIRYGGEHASSPHDVEEGGTGGAVSDVGVVPHIPRRADRRRDRARGLSADRRGGQPSPTQRYSRLPQRRDSGEPRACRVSRRYLFHRVQQISENRACQRRERGAGSRVRAGRRAPGGGTGQQPLCRIPCTRRMDGPQPVRFAGRSVYQRHRSRPGGHQHRLLMSWAMPPATTPT